MPRGCLRGQHVAPAYDTLKARFHINTLSLILLFCEMGTKAILPLQIAAMSEV